MIKSQQMFKTQRGFTLIEILVVLVIIGLLVGIVAVNVTGEADKARVQRVHADFKQIETALELYKLDNYVYPSSEQGLQALVEKPALEPIPKKWKKDGYLPRFPKDPWDNEYKYLSPGEHGKFDLYSYGADNAPGGEDQAADIGNWQAEDDKDS